MLEVLELVSECSSPALSAVLKVAKRVLQLIQIIGPLLLIISLVLNLIKLMSNPDDKKLGKKIKNAIIATVILFFVPTLINVVMNMFDESFSVAACWNNIGDYNGTNEYISDDDVKKNSLLTDPSEYENGEKKSSTDSSTSTTIEGTAQSIGDVVWDSSDVTKISNLTSAQLIGILSAKGGNAKNFIPYASGLITAEHKYNVNVFFLIGVEALESGWITSRVSRNCNNLGGVCASSAHPSNGCGSNSNCSFAYFTSVNNFIDYHANMLHSNYLTPGGSYYHGTSPQAVVTNYCPGCSSWPSNVISIANSLFQKASSVV
jgi:beta-N-acetylglucosaminidase